MKTYAFVLSALLMGAAVAADAPMAMGSDTAKTAMKKHHHKKHAMGDSTAMAAPAPAMASSDTTATKKKHHHKKHAMADSAAAK